MPSGGQKAVANLGLSGASGILNSECKQTRPNGPGSPVTAKPPQGRPGDKINGMKDNPAGASSMEPKVGSKALDRAEDN